MKVGMLTSTAEHCGIAVYSRDLARGMVGLADLQIVPVWDKVQPWDTYLNDSVRRLHGCDLVHIQHEYSFWGSVLPGQNKFFRQAATIRQPIVMTAHTLDSVEDVLGLGLPGSPIKRLAKRLLALMPPYKRVIESETFKVADRLIVHDSYSARLLQARGIDEDKIRVIPMGVPIVSDGNSSGEGFRDKHGLSGRKLITVFGFVRPGRGYETALAALAELTSETTLVIAGGPQTKAQEVYLARLMSTVKSLGLEDRVLVTGYLSEGEVTEVMLASDVILMPQEKGTGSYSLQVALPYGRPIVSSDLPFFTALEDQGCLVSFRRRDSEDLAYKLNLLLTDLSLRKSLAQRAIACAADHSWEKTAASTIEVYAELI